MNPRHAEGLNPKVEHHVLADIEGVVVVIETESLELPETDTIPATHSEAEIDATMIGYMPAADVPDFFEEVHEDLDGIHLATAAEKPTRRLPDDSSAVLMQANPENEASRIEWELAA